MATFQYQARTADGRVITGLIQADNETTAVRTLDERSLFPIRVTEQQAARTQQRRLRLRDVGITYGQLADLLRAGVPLLRALETIAKAGINERLAGVLRRVGEGVSGGKDLAEAMGEFPEAFSPLHVAMVRAGEKAGFLEDVLSNLSNFIERVDELQGKIRGAMIYPVVLTVLGMSVTVFMLMWFVPRFKTIFVGRDLPFVTELMFGISDTLVNNWPLVFGAVVGVVLAVVLMLRSEAGALLWARVKLRLPILGRVVRTIAITRFCRVLGTMLANGVPILQALHISKDATGLPVLAGHIEEAAESVRGGETLAEPLRASGMIPPQILEMIAIAEESNQLDRVLVEIAETVERRTDRQVDQAVHLIEPLILVLMAAMIGMLAVGLLYPILTMAQSLRT